MEDFTVEDLKGKSIFVGTPMYGGNCVGYYTRSVLNLAMVCTKYGIDIRFHTLFNESLITRARNYIVDEFLRSDCSHLLFIDSDIGFDFKDALTLLHLCNSKDDKGIIGGPYPKKDIAWEKVKRAVDLGYGNDQPKLLEKFIGDLVFNPLNISGNFLINEPLQVRETGTGFLMIHRSVFEEWNKQFPNRSYKPDHVKTENFDGKREIMAYFDCIIDPESKRYLSEDYMFCHESRKLGIDTWLCPWMKLVHVGTYSFFGDITALALLDNNIPATEGMTNLQ